WWIRVTLEVRVCCFPQTSAGIVRIVNDTTDVVLDLRDAIARVVSKLDPASAWRRDAADVAGSSTSSRYRDLIAIAIADSLKRSDISEYISQPITKLQVPAVTVPKQACFIERSRSGGVFVDCISKSGTWRDAHEMDAGAVRKNQISFLVVIDRIEKRLIAEV